MADMPITIRIRSDTNQDMDWMVRPEDVTFPQTLEVLSQIMPHLSHTAFEYEDEDGDRITVRSDDELKDMFNYYYGEICEEDRARGLFPPLIIYPKHGKTPQIRNVHGLKIRTGSQSNQQEVTVEANNKPANGGFESILKSGKITKNCLHYVQMIGQGNGGRVYRAVHKSSGQTIAVKDIVLDISVAVQKQIISELEILYKCHSRMIISFFGAFFHENRISMCTEYMDGGSLDRYMPVSERVLGQISICVIEGMFYMWNLKILHRDIKPCNILVNTAGEVKLCDFGVSTQLVKSIATSHIGTSVYMAPERVQGQEYSTPAEVWSFGVTLYELATGRLPFPSLNKMDKSAPFEIMKIVVEEPHQQLPPDQYSQELIDLINKCLPKSQVHRLSGQQLSEHPYIQQQKNTDRTIISQMVASHTQR